MSDTDSRPARTRTPMDRPRPTRRARLSAWFDRRWMPILLGATVVVLALVYLVAVLASGGAR